MPYTFTFDAEKATPTAKRILKQVNAARAGKPVDWPSINRRIPLPETVELRDWADKELEALQTSHTLTSVERRFHYRVLRRFIGELFDADGNPEPLAQYFEEFEPDAPEAARLRADSNELAALLPDNGEFMRQCASQLARRNKPKPVSRRRSKASRRKRRR
ncbi:MAG: hypothetical protein KC561_20170 [Myxococcales bacterium]|nr:hypothetical protein [Myxococcales bacterium]